MIGLILYVLLGLGIAGFGLIATIKPDTFVSGDGDEIGFHGSKYLGCLGMFFAIFIYIFRLIIACLPTGIQSVIIRLVGVCAVGLGGFMFFILAMAFFAPQRDYGYEDYGYEDDEGGEVRQIRLSPEQKAAVAAAMAAGDTKTASDILIGARVPDADASGPAAAPAAAAAPTVTPAPVPPPIGKADEFLAQASAAWQKGDFNAALQAATYARNIRKAHLGAVHPKVQEVEKMITAATAKLNAPAAK